MPKARISSSTPAGETRAAVLQAMLACEAKKADDVAVLQLAPNSGAFTDYFVLASGGNPRQVQAIADEVELQLQAAGSRPVSIEGYKQAEWVLLDYVDFVVHVFSESARRYYDLERLWKSAERIDAAELRSPRAKAAAEARKAAPVRRAARPSTRAMTKRGETPAKRRGAAPRKRAPAKPRKRK